MAEGKFEGGRELSFDVSLEQLKGIFATLRELGCRMPHYADLERHDFKAIIKESWEKKDPFPVALDGLDGIRVSPRPEGFFVWFTNGFDVV